MSLKQLAAWRYPEHADRLRRPTTNCSHGCSASGSKPSCSSSCGGSGCSSKLKPRNCFGVAKKAETK